MNAIQPHPNSTALAITQPAAIQNVAANIDSPVKAAPKEIREAVFLCWTLWKTYLPDASFLAFNLGHWINFKGLSIQDALSILDAVTTPEFRARITSVWEFENEFSQLVTRMKQRRRAEEIDRQRREEWEAPQSQRAARPGFPVVAASSGAARSKVQRRHARRCSRPSRGRTS